MIKPLLISFVLGMCVAQSSIAAETTFQSNPTLGYTVTNISASSNYGSGRGVYSRNGGAYVSSNDEISRAIDNLSAPAKQKEYQQVMQARLISRPTLADFTEFERWANQGNVEYQIELAVMYDRGEGVRQDYTKAAEWYNKAANQGSASAQYNLGVMYYRGEGVRQDRAKAAELYSKAANQGHVDAQYNLALMYDNGDGVPKNGAKAAELYSKAANQGHVDAQYNLTPVRDKRSKKR